MKNATVIVLAGQSNAVGVGHICHLPDHFPPEKVKEYEAGYPNIQINYFSHDKRSGGFVPTELNCTELKKKTLGPEVSMAEMLTEICPDDNVFIVKCAFGGSSLWRDWLSPSGGDSYDATSYADQVESVTYALDNNIPLRAGWAYNELVKILNESLETLKEKGYDPKIRGFCWMQGESDADIPEHAEPYAERYDALLRDFTAAFSPYLSDCVFVDGGISEVWPLYRIINQQKAEYADSHANCVFLDTIGSGLTTSHEPVGGVDLAHYDSDSVVRLGKMFIEALKLPRKN